MNTNPRNAPFGSVLAGTMAVAHYRDGAWGATEFRNTGPLEIHPASHALHYGSECFEGFKAYKHADGSVHVFRLDAHIARMQNSARLLVLPEPDPLPPGPPYPPPPPQPQPWPPCGLGGECWPGGQLPPGWY